MNRESKRFRPASGVLRPGSGVGAPKPASGVGAPKPASGVGAPKPASSARLPSPGSQVRNPGSTSKLGAPPSGKISSSSSGKIGSSSSGKIGSSSSGKIGSSSSGKISSGSSGRLGAPNPGSGVARPSSKIGNPPSSRILRGQQEQEAAAERPATGGLRISNIKSGPKVSSAKIFGLAAVGIAALIGIALWIGSLQPDAKKIKEELHNEFKEITKRIPVEKITELDEALQPLLVVPRYMKYGGDVYKMIKQEAGKVHLAAEQEKKALPEVLPALAKWDALKGDLEKNKDGAQALYDQMRGLDAKFNSSQNGPKIHEALLALKDFLEHHQEQGWAGAFLGCRNEFDKFFLQNDFTQARKVLDDFGVKFKEKEIAEQAKELNDRREKLDRTSVAHVEKVLKEAERLKKDDKLSDAKKLVEKNVPLLEGFDAQIKLKAFLK